MLSKMVFCTSQPVALMATQAFMEIWQELETSHRKADQSTFGSGVVVISWFIDEAIDWKPFLAILCICAKFLKPQIQKLILKKV